MVNWLKGLLSRKNSGIPEGLRWTPLYPPEPRILELKEGDVILLRLPEGPMMGSTLIQKISSEFKAMLPEHMQDHVVNAVQGIEIEILRETKND